MGSERNGAMRVVDVGWRVLAVAAVYAILFLGFDVLSGTRLSAQSVAIGLITGAGIALVLLPLARRLPYRMPVRILALFAILYWIFSLGNLVEAWFFTTISHGSLVAAAIFLAIPSLAAAWMIAWLLPASAQAGPVPRLRDLLGERPLQSWAWRLLLAGVLFAVVLQLAGTAWGPLISRYYHDPAYIAQAHIASPAPPAYVGWIEEGVRGLVFALVLLPLLAVFRGRDWPSLLALGAYVALIDAVLESWLTMLGNTSFPLGFRIGEGLDLTTDAIVRGVFVALLLALPAATRAIRPTPAAATWS